MASVLADIFTSFCPLPLERICAEKQLIGHEDLSRRQQEWRRAYLNTPHGQPIDLLAAFTHDRREGESRP
jgi:hypothetical protein